MNERDWEFELNEARIRRQERRAERLADFVWLAAALAIGAGAGGLVHLLRP